MGEGRASYGTRSQGISQFYLHTPRSSANGMNHTYFNYLPFQPKLVLIYRPLRDGRLSWLWVSKTIDCIQQFHRGPHQQSDY